MLHSFLSEKDLENLFKIFKKYKGVVIIIFFYYNKKKIDIGNQNVTENKQAIQGEGSFLYL